MKTSKFTIISEVSIDHNNSWNDKELHLLAKDILQGERLDGNWDTKNIKFSTNIKSIKRSIKE